MGFTQDQAVRALRARSDNVDQALELLLNVRPSTVILGGSSPGEEGN